MDNTFVELPMQEDTFKLVHRKRAHWQAGGE
jgi:hypothetical protein